MDDRRAEAAEAFFSASDFAPASGSIRASKFRMIKKAMMGYCILSSVMAAW
jgi:hypothetical protein